MLRRRLVLLGILILPIAALALALTSRGNPPPLDVSTARTVHRFTLSGRVASPAMQSESFRLRRQIVGSGGQVAASASYRTHATVGEALVGGAESDLYLAGQGYWPDHTIPAGGCCGQYTGGYTGNTNCDVDGKLNLSDITAAITRVYIDPVTPLCCEENGDVNCDTKMNLSDITNLITKVYLDPAFQLCGCP